MNPIPRPERPAIGQDTATSERRLANRRAVSASADILDASSGARLSARVADLGPEGCYLDTINVLLEGSRIHLRIRRGDAELLCAATVRYAQPGIGMGVAFVGLDEPQRSLLQRWIEDINPHARIDDSVFGAVPEPAPFASADSAGAVLMRLIELLHSKGLLSEAELHTLLSGDGA